MSGQQFSYHKICKTSINISKMISVWLRSTQLGASNAHWNKQKETKRWRRHRGPQNLGKKTKKRPLILAKKGLGASRSQKTDLTALPAWCVPPIDWLVSRSAHLCERDRRRSGSKSERREAEEEKTNKKAQPRRDAQQQTNLRITPPP